MSDERSRRNIEGRVGGIGGCDCGYFRIEENAAIRWLVTDGPLLVAHGQAPQRERTT
jgi:hypothetical protein